MEIQGELVNSSVGIAACNIGCGSTVGRQRPGTTPGYRSQRQALHDLAVISAWIWAADFAIIILPFVELVGWFAQPTPMVRTDND